MVTEEIDELKSAVMELREMVALGYVDDDSVLEDAVDHLAAIIFKRDIDAHLLTADDRRAMRLIGMTPENEEQARAWKELRVYTLWLAEHANG